jgi:caa(3)-type oxidase subunit IV
MTDTAHPPDADHAHAHHGPPTIQPYLVVFGALAVFTAVSFLVNVWVRSAADPEARGGRAMLGFFIILGVAVVKAVLVGLYFMHLKWDWRRVGFMIAPAFILGAMFAFVLMPDIVLAWHKEPAGPGIAESRGAGGGPGHGPDERKGNP